MNYVYLIGNGFDKAHGLKTGYEDFIFDIHDKALRMNVPDGNSHKSGLLKVGNSESTSQVFKNFDELKHFCERYSIKITYPNWFFKELMRGDTQKRWVDIEYFYYQQIQKILDDAMLGGDYTGIARLNKEFIEVKDYFLKYLETLDINSKPVINEITHHIQTPRSSIEKNLFLNFNYTTLIEKYADKTRGDVVVNIHGTMGKTLDSIVFGYGDEMDLDYKKIERLNINAFLDHFKSFAYLKNENYTTLDNFLQTEFKVVIMGHSCGISDRVLLNHVFEHPNCKKIIICYHQKNENETDFFVKTQDISRHFSAAKKHEMRKRILHLEESNPLIPYVEKVQDTVN